MKKYVCSICGYVYDEALGDPERGIAPGTPWEDVPEEWVCPLCTAEKNEFSKQDEDGRTDAVEELFPEDEDGEDLRELTPGELSALCSNLAKGCEKQYLLKESELFAKLADYYRQKSSLSDPTEMSKLLALVEKDLTERYPRTFKAAERYSDRGTLRALTWGEKVTKILKSLVQRYESSKGEFLENTNVYLCEICGFIYVGDNPPELCPVCKVPGLKISRIERG